MAARPPLSTSQSSIEVRIDTLSHEGRGVARVAGKAVFVDGALPGETVRIRYLRRRRRYDEAAVLEVPAPSPERVEPICPHYDKCGGCTLQHLSPEAQIRHKQAVLLEHLRHEGGIGPGMILPPLRGPDRAYRRRARLSVKHVDRKGRVLVGFREPRSSFVADIDSCPVLDPRLSALLPELGRIVGELSIRDAVPQIEVAAGDDRCALVFRHLRDMPEQDRAHLSAFGERFDVEIHLQPGGEDSVRSISGGSDAPLTYRLEEEGLDIGFGPTDFTQVNFEINRKMVRQVLELLAPRRDERILDLYCGIGNFSLALARHCAGVTGVEGSEPQIARARENARQNGIGNVEFHRCDLETCDARSAFLSRGYAKILLDPPRTGARALLGRLPLEGVSAIVYVSCNPATFARDAAILVNGRGYLLHKVGVMDMFPHTSHVESIALFVPA